MSRVLPTTKNKPCNHICRKTGLNDTCVVKPATLLFNSFCCNVAKQIARFLLPALLVTLFLIVRHKVATARAEQVLGEHTFGAREINLEKKDEPLACVLLRIIPKLAFRWIYIYHASCV